MLVARWHNTSRDKVKSKRTPTLKIEDVLQQTHCWIVADVLAAWHMGSVCIVAARIDKNIPVLHFIGHIWVTITPNIGLMQIPNYAKHT